MAVHTEIINGEKYVVYRDTDGSVVSIVGDPARDLAKKIAKAEAEEFSKVESNSTHYYGSSGVEIPYSQMSKKDKRFMRLVSLGGILTVGFLLAVPLAILLLFII